MTTESILLPEEVARALRVHKNTVLLWLREGKLKGFKAGKGWRISSAALTDFTQPTESHHA